MPSAASGNGGVVFVTWPAGPTEAELMQEGSGGGREVTPRCLPGSNQRWAPARKLTTATAETTAGGQDERRCKYTPPGFPPPTGWLGFNASGAPDTATGLSRHGREDARETREEGHGRRHVRVALGSEQAAASISFFSFFLFSFGGMILCFHSVLVHSDPQYLSERIGEL